MRDFRPLLQRPIIALACTALVGCDSLTAVDRRTNDALRMSAEQVGDVAALPRYDPSKYEEGDAFPLRANDAPTSRNPAVADLPAERDESSNASAQSIIDRFNNMVGTAANAELLTFPDSLRFAAKHSTEYLTAEEAYIIQALELLIEEHRWGPRFFNETSAAFAANADNDGRYATAVSVMNTFGLTQKLPGGGEVSARFLVSATEELDNAIGQSGQSADLLLDANIPLLRGAGSTAQESLVQSRRDLIYAAREFQSFTRQFYFELATDYLQLIFQKQQIVISEGQVERSREVEQRTVALVESGRTEPFQADLARQNTLFAIDRLAQLKDNFRLSIDRFKLRIGMDTSLAIDVSPDALRLEAPKVSLDEAVRFALDFRLDLQTEVDRVQDARRIVDVAKNRMQGDLNLVLASNVPTDGDRVRGGLGFQPGQIDYTAGIVYSLPLDRTEEDARYRQSQIRLEQQKRNLGQLNDRAAVEARRAVRAIEKARFTLLISERNVETSENRVAAINAAPDRATARDNTEAVNNLQRAQDNLEQSKRDLQVAILGYLVTTGQLRVDGDGQLVLPPGMRNEPAP
ncbi:MAG: TolC family protein [Phycisphaerae bacterium]|nr:TolC family protein [Phycisphaerae bacterium]